MATRPKPNLRSYGGVSGERRSAARRERLLEAGMELFGTYGFAASSVKAVCAEAGLSERYFYESFADREDLLYALYERVVEQVTTATVTGIVASEPGAQARSKAGLSAFFGVLTGDMRKARLLSIEVVGVSERLEARRRRTIHAFAALIAHEVELARPGARLLLDPTLTAMMLVGGTNELVIEWLLTEEKRDPEVLVEHCAQVFLALYRATFASSADDAAKPA